MPSVNGHVPKGAILYARVSTDEQARSGYSLAQQLEALREYARYAQKLWIGDFVRHAVYLPEKVTQRAGALTPVGRIHRYVQSTSGQDGA